MDIEEPIVRKILLDANLADAKPVSHVEVRRITMAPHTLAGAHIHNCPVVGSILEGSVTFKIIGQDDRILEPGDTFFEPADVVIEKFDAGAEGAVFDAYYLLGRAETPTIEMDVSAR